MPEARMRQPAEPEADRDRSDSDAWIVAFMNQKGGVGKTTTTVNVAAAIAEIGRRVLVVDLDPQAHATLHLGVDPETVEGSVYDLLLDPGMDPKSVLLESRPNLALIPAEVNLAAAESELATAGGRQTRLATALGPLRKDFDFVFIDCPPSLGLLTINALAAAREVLIPMQAHFLALQGVGKLLESVRLVGGGVNASLEVGGVILCMHDENTNHSREVVADLDAFFEQARATDAPWRNARVLRPPIRRNIKLAECPSFGQTIFEYATWCPGALDYRRLADQILSDRAAAAQSENAAVVVVRAPERAGAGV